MASPQSRYGCMLVVSGPSGAGKSTLCRRLLAADAGLCFSISCTTRAPRPGEVDGVDYRFISREEFARRVEAGEFVEHAEVHGNRYGTPASEVMGHLEAGRDVLLDIDVQGAAQIRAGASGQPWEQAAAFLFVGPPSYAELERRLRGRGTEPEEIIRRRLAMAAKELGQWGNYDYCIINGDVDVALAQFAAVLTAERVKTARRRGQTPWPDMPKP